LSGFPRRATFPWKTTLLQWLVRWLGSSSDAEQQA
jgi:hypothetical protein